MYRKANKKVNRFDILLYRPDARYVISRKAFYEFISCSYKNHKHMPSASTKEMLLIQIAIWTHAQHIIATFRNHEIGKSKKKNLIKSTFDSSRIRLLIFIKRKKETHFSDICSFFHSVFDFKKNLKSRIYFHCEIFLSHLFQFENEKGA